MQRVLVAGATGALGKRIVDELKQRGHEVRALSRSRERALALGLRDEEIVVADACASADALAEAVKGTDRVVSALGAPVTPSLGARASFFDVDTRANLHLLEAARAASVPRFVYVSTAGRGAVEEARYVLAHRQVEEALERARADLSSTAVRPTGYFSALGSFVDMARKGTLPLLGGGDARSNPIHDEDLARVVVDHLDEGPPVVEAGGPEVLTRFEMGALAFEALDMEPRFRVVPAGAVRFIGGVMGLVHPRMGELLEFYERLHRVDVVAPTRGARTLGAYFRERARAAPRLVSAAPR